MAFKSIGKPTNEKLIQITKESAIRFQIKANLPARVLQYDCFYELLNNAASCLPKSDFKISRFEYEKRLKVYHNADMDLIKEKLNAAREYMRKDLNDTGIGVIQEHEKGSIIQTYRGSFLVAGHDGYDTKRRKAFSSCIFFICPIEWKYYEIVTGLSPQGISGEAIQAKKHFDKQVVRFGVQKGDLFNSMSDNAAVAKLTSVLILSNQDKNTMDTETKYVTCKMHTASLVYKHALGYSKKKDLTAAAKTISGRTTFLSQLAPFDHAQTLMETVAKITSYINDRKNKQRFAAYKEVCKGFRFLSHSETRIVFQHRQMEQILRSKFSLSNFFSSNKRHEINNYYFLSGNEADTYSLKEGFFGKIAEVVAISEELVKVINLVQCSGRITTGVDMLLILDCKLHYRKSTKFQGVNVDSHEGWDASTSYEKLLRNNTKIYAKRYEGIHKGIPSGFPFSYLSSEGETLVSRIQQVLDFYFDDSRISRAEILGFVLNPISFFAGRHLVKAYDEILSHSLPLYKRAIKFLEEEYNMEKDNLIQPGKKQRKSASKEDLEVYSFGFERTWRPPPCESEMESEDTVEKTEVDMWLQQKVDWKQEFQLQKLEFDESKYKEKGYLYLFEAKLDPLMIWKSLVPNYPILHRLALRYLAIPSSNAFLERAFSNVTLSDTPRRQNRKDDTVEIQFLSNINSNICNHLRASNKIEETLFSESISEKIKTHSSDNFPMVYCTDDEASSDADSLYNEDDQDS